MDKVSTALKDVCFNREKRAKGLGFAGQTEITNLRRVMFGRHPEGEAFQELSQRELGILESAIVEYEKKKRFLCLRGDQHRRIYYMTLRYDLLGKAGEVSGSEFRAASLEVTQFILGSIIGEYRLSPEDCAMMLPWRAALAFGQAAISHGIRRFYHLGVYRDERTLQPITYFEEKPDELYTSNGKVIIADPMLATGGTVITAIEKLKLCGVTEEQMIVASVISAPEGVDRVLQAYPKVRIVTGAHDERLNVRGYICPGLGDYGDLFLRDIDDSVLRAWKKQRILTPTALEALQNRMAAVTIA